MFAACSSTTSAGDGATAADAGGDATTGASASDSSGATGDASSPDAQGDDAGDAFTGPVDAGVDAYPIVRAPDGGCFLRASDYDQSCAVDSDCVLVRSAGGDVCDINSNATGCFNCFFGTVNGMVASQYNAAMDAVRQAYEAQPVYTPFDESCPVFSLAAACIGQHCTVVVDAGADARAADGSVAPPLPLANPCK